MFQNNAQIMHFCFILRINIKKTLKKVLAKYGVLGGTRTPDRALRRRMLCPAELRGQCAVTSYQI